MADKEINPMNPNMIDDDDDDGPSRRIASNFNPSNLAMMEPNMPSFTNGPSFGNNSMMQSAVQAKQAAALAVPPPSARYVWKLKEIPTLPDLLPLERSAVFVENVTTQEVAKRISEILHSRSIEATYNDEKAKVKCVTEDGVEFRVRLYRGRGNFSHGIIAEVQRRFGASSNFQCEINAILDAVQGKKTIKAPTKTSIPMPPAEISDEEDDYEPDDGSSAMRMVFTMLNAPSPDSTYLGLQTLMSLTDRNKIGEDTARKVSNKLMQIDSVVGGKVLGILLENGEEETFKVRAMAMTILANALNSMTVDLDAWIKEQLRPLLLDELKNAEKHPRVAFQAARCVERLLKYKEQISDFQVALEVAQKTGASRHAGLERQVKKCLDIISGNRD